MHCIDLNLMMSRRFAHGVTVGNLVCMLALAGCSGTRPAFTPPSEPVSATVPVPVRGTSLPSLSLTKMPTPEVSRNWNEFKLQAAKRMVAANPNGTFTGKPQQMLLAVPVIEFELYADGSIKSVDIMRRPSQAPETTQLAIDAVRRAAPFGDVSKLPKPWKFVETFLFNDDKRFKPRTLDAN